MKDKPRAYTVEEMRQKFLDQMRLYKEYWLNEDHCPEVEGKLDGLCFSILNILDGTSMGTPAFDLIPSVHEDDQAYHESEGENWWAEEVINDCHLHDLWCKKP